MREDGVDLKVARIQVQEDEYVIHIYMCTYVYMHHVECYNMSVSVYVSNKLCRKDGVGLKARIEEQEEEYVTHIYMHVYTHI